MVPSVCGVSLAVVVVLVTLVSPGGACPRPCSCYQPTELHCTFRSLLTIPQPLPQHTLHINLGFNSINRIPDSSLAGLRRLELLMLHGNDICEIPDEVFQDLSSLQVLKLSYNKLREISAESFSGLSSLLRLHLDHNRLQFLHPQALLCLPNLRLIRLQGNRLHQLHPQAFCTLSLLQTFCYSTLRHLDVSNNSLTILPRDTLRTAPLLESLALQANPWTCDCSMAWLQAWSISHPGVLKCPGPQCPVCASPKHMKGCGLLQQKDLSCTPPVISTNPRASSQEDGEVQPIETFREALGDASLGMSDQQGNAVDLKCNITHSSQTPDITSPHLSSSSIPLSLSLSLSLSLDCGVDVHSYERLWRLLAYYSETPVRLQREIMLSKAPRLAYRYRQTAEKEGYYHTGVKANLQAQPAWLLQPHVSLELNRAQSSAHRVKLTLSTLVSAPPDPPSPHSWVLIQTNHTHTAFTAAADSQIHLPCPVLSSIADLSSRDPRLQWVFPDGSTVSSPYRSSDGRIRVSGQGLVLQRVDHSDAGLYYCVARAGGDVDVLPLRLAVVESSNPPPGEELGPAVTGLVGDPVSLPCEASGTPRVEVNWVLPGGRVVGSRNEGRRKGAAGVNVLANGTLSLPLPALGDAGLYRCVAVNLHGADSLSTRLTLIPHPSDTSSRMRYPMRPQSALGVSNRVPAPLSEEVEEGGSGDDEGEEENMLPTRAGYNRTRRPPIRSHTVRMEGSRPPQKGKRPLRRGFPVEQRRNRLEGRRSFNLAKHKIDPQKWADLLAKIRERTAPKDSLSPWNASNRPGQRRRINRPRGRPTPRQSTPVPTNRAPSSPPKASPPTTGTQAGLNPASTPPHSLPASPDHSMTAQRPPQTSVLRVRPRIAPPHMRPMSVPAEIDALLPCEAIGQPPPTITWTKVSTGAVMSLDSKAERFQVLPNGTFLIRSVQVQDRGTYICSAQNSVGLDRAMVTLEVWSRPPHIQLPNHRDATVHQGGEVRLECRAQGVPVPLLSWVLPDRSVLTPDPNPNPALGPHSRVSIFPNGTLRILVAGPADRGLYRCVASNPSGAGSLSVRLHVSSLPPAIQQPREERITRPAGMPLYAQCSARGAPAPSIRWRTPDGTLLRPSQFLNGNLFVLPNATLLIRKLATKDSGSYECLATNAVATGNPEPRVVWRTPGKKLVDAHYSFDKRMKVHSNGTLYIQSVTEKDGGGYLCVARNKMADDYRILQVTVVTKPAKIKPKQPSNQKVVSYGAALKVDCLATGQPDPAVRWSLPNGTSVKSVLLQVEERRGRSRRLVVFDNGTLFLPSVEMGQEGEYVCHAENHGGRDTMRVMVKVLTSPPSFPSTKYEVIKVQQGGQVALNCGAKGQPVPTITWLSPMNRVLPVEGSGPVGVRQDGSLVIQGARGADGGNYTCRASNAAGERSKVMGVEVMVTPPSFTLNGAGGGINGADRQTAVVSGSGLSAVISISQSAGRDHRVSAGNCVNNNGDRNVGDQRVSAVRGQTVLLPCPSQGFPPPRLAWLLPGNGVLPVPYYGSRLTVHRNGTLELRGVRASDAGMLVCVNRSERGEARIMVHLEVSDTKDTPHSRGSVTTEKPCPVGPVSTEQLRTGGPDTEETPSPRGPVTTEKSRQETPRPTGPVTTEKPRPRGPVPEAGRSVVLERKPVVTNISGSLVSIINGENLQLPCPQTDSPSQGSSQTQSLTWKLPSGVVVSRGQTAGTGRYSVLDDGTLTVQKVSVFDRGTYSCQSTNQDTSSILTVPVIVIAYPPRITNGPPPLTYTRPGVAVQLTCYVIATPRATITWEMPDQSQLRVTGQARLYGNRYLSPQGSLVIQNPTSRDTGFYRCSAWNVIGADTKATYLHVI
ncbi:hypothetical protein J4Q44_G00147670 [Coregonus suidteri]|uniref:Ig-like domain-containing protein n=1 Tax=Coregonus suidteri TaxID=861788 RepID=A0AAN8LML2_9TELE